MSFPRAIARIDAEAICSSVRGALTTQLRILVCKIPPAKSTIRLSYRALTSVNFVHRVNNFVNVVYMLRPGLIIKQ